MFVVIYTPGLARQTGKQATEQPFFREHVTYMRQVFAAKQLLMGGPFLDHQGALGILDVEGEAQAWDIVTHDPFVLGRVLEPHLHPWNAYFNQYQERRAPERQADGDQGQSGEKRVGEKTEKPSPTDAEQDGTRAGEVPSTALAPDAIVENHQREENTLENQPLPTITDDYMVQMHARAGHYSLMILKSGQARHQDGADNIIWEHARRIHALRVAGLLPIVCPVNDGSELEGIGIFNTSVEEAKTLMDEDPGVKAGIFVSEIHPCRGEFQNLHPGDSLPKERAN
jgi:uncharacterized protein YciI